jgi:hypothetical protein
LPVIIGIISDARKRKEHGRLRIVFGAKRRLGYAPLDCLPVSRFESCRGHGLNSANMIACNIRATRGQGTGRPAIWDAPSRFAAPVASQAR